MKFVLQNIGSKDSRWKNGFGDFTQCLIFQNDITRWPEQPKRETRCVAHFVGEWAKRDAVILISALNGEPETTIKLGTLVVTNIAEKFGTKERTIFMSQENETEDSVYILLMPKFTCANGMFHQYDIQQNNYAPFSATIWNDPIMQNRNYVPFSKNFLQQ